MVKIKLDKERSLRYDLNAMEKFEDVTGKSLADPKTLQENIRIKDMKALLWVGLLFEDPSLTLEQLGSMVDTDNLDVLAIALNAYGGKGNDGKTPL